jgi:hypothetical protein
MFGPLRFVNPDGRREVEITVTRYIAQPFVLFPIPALGDNRSVQGGTKIRVRLNTVHLIILMTMSLFLDLWLGLTDARLG